MLDGHPIANVTLDPLDDYLVIEPLDESELPSGLIVPANEASQVRSGIVAAVGPDVTRVEPGDKVLFPREAGYEVRLARSSHRVRVLKREDLIARISTTSVRVPCRPIGGVAERSFAAVSKTPSSVVKRSRVS